MVYSYSYKFEYFEFILTINNISFLINIFKMSHEFIPDYPKLVPLSGNSVKGGISFWFCTNRDWHAQIKGPE